MSSQTATITTMATNTGKNKRFELPALEFSFGSLTDGTDIPPPLPSPVQEEAAPTPPDTPQTEKGQQPEGADAANDKPDAASPESDLSNGSVTGSKRRADELGPASPTVSSRPSSIRRLFSRTLLNPGHAGDGAGQEGKRPPSRGGSSVADSRKSKRSSGWFGRLRSNDQSSISIASKPVSPVSPAPTVEKLPAGPPPPMIPELSELNSKLGLQNDSGLGTDLFKDIK